MITYDTYWRGYNSTSWILLTTVIINIAYYIFKSPNKSQFKAYSASIYIISLTFIASFLLIETIKNFNSKKIYQKDKFRLETSIGRGLFSPPTLPNLFVSETLIEKKYTLYCYSNNFNYSYKNSINFDPIDIKQIVEYYNVNFLVGDDTVKTSTDSKLSHK